MSAGFSSVPLVAVSRLLPAFVDAMPGIEPRLVPLDEAEGLVLAKALIAPGPMPPRAVALRPGWAVAARSTAGAGPYSPVFLSAAPVFVKPGALLPPGTDAVLPPDVVQAAGFPEVGEAVAPGDGVRRAGEDAVAGAMLCTAGQRLSAIHVAAAREAGIELCHVRSARVTVVGDPHGAAETFLARFSEREGAVVTRIRIAATDWARAVTGETSAYLLVGLDPDEALEALSGAGGTVLGRMAARPGEGTLCGLLNGRPVIVAGQGLAEAVAVAALVLGPWLERVTGGSPPPRRSGRLTRKLASGVGLTEIALVRIVGSDVEPLAVADLTLTALARADALVVVPPESEGWPAGAVVEAVDL